MGNLQREVRIPCRGMPLDSVKALKTSIVRQAGAQGIKATVTPLASKELVVTIDGANELKIAAYEAALISWRQSNA